MLLIKKEELKDYNDVYNVIKDAFLSAEHSDGNEHDLVNVLRQSKSFIPELSLVAEIDGKIVGHILFTKASVGKDTVLALAPLSVLPKFQKKGIGSALVSEGHNIAKKLGYSYSVVLGSEKYYPKFGYIPAVNLGINTPVGVPEINFMAVKLNENAAPIKCNMVYAKEFGI